MKQLVQSMRTGETSVHEVPINMPAPGMVLVRTAASLVSAGTERMALDFAGKSLLQKARSRPDLVRQVIGKARVEGMATALDAAFSRLDRPVSLGYSAAGTVFAVGEGVTNLRPGDRVACAGAGCAVHAEFICVPQNLVARFASGDATGDVSFEEAAFATVGAIAMHGFRLSGATVGETVAVIGLGLIGNLAAQIAKAAGCRVLGMDPNPQRAQLARGVGCDFTACTADEFADSVQQATGGMGADAVLITAATSSNQPVELAARVARGRARVVAVGAVGSEVPRKSFYEKELEFIVARSYGPGRYDPAYEEKGNDYPPEYVRWTENRNLGSFLGLVAEKKVQPAPLITHRFPIENGVGAYDLITGKIGEPFLAVLITYSADSEVETRVDLRSDPVPATAPVSVGVLGAGSFAQGVLLPAMAAHTQTTPVGICAATGLSSETAGKKFGFQYCASDENRILEDSRINTIVVATRHNLHARQVIAALAAGKNIFCEKPLCLTEEELAAIVLTHQRAGAVRLMVGYNRRFAPMVAQMRAFLSSNRDPLLIQYRINAGFIPANHWIQDPEIGGGRILGEVCHFVDLAHYLARSMPVRVQARALPDVGRYSQDNFVASIEFENGSLATITYAACGDKSASKERLEVFGGGATCILDDFRRLTLARSSRHETKVSRLRQDKGHRAEWAAFANAILRGEQSPISLEELIASSLVTFAITASLRSGKVQDVDVAGFMAAAVTPNTAPVTADESFHRA